MPNRSEFSRRHLLRAGAASAVGISGIGTVSAIDDVTEEVDNADAADDVTDAVEDPAAVVESADQIHPPELEDQTEIVPVSGVPETATTIRPGSQLLIDYPNTDTTSGCTADFVWRSGGTYYLGTAGHCFLPEGDADQTTARNHESGFDVGQLNVRVCLECTFGGLSGKTMEGETVELGDVAFARDTNPDPDDETGVGHDFGLVEIPRTAVDEGLVDPSVPQFGGPHGVANGAIPTGQTVCKYGAGVGHGETFATMGANGSSLGDLETDGAWFAALRATPGDSGAPLQSTKAGAGVEGDDAGGVLTHLTATGVAGTTMARCQELTATDAGLDIAPVLAGEL